MDLPQGTIMADSLLFLASSPKPGKNTIQYRAIPFNPNVHVPQIIKKSKQTNGQVLHVDMSLSAIEFGLSLLHQSKLEGLEFALQEKKPVMPARTKGSSGRTSRIECYGLSGKIENCYFLQFTVIRVKEKWKW